MSWLGTLLKEVFTSEPQDESKLPQMSDRQKYNYLISRYFHLTPDEMETLVYLHKKLGIRD